MKIYFDMDGVMATWDNSKTIDDVCRDGYFLTCKPMLETIECICGLIDKGYDINIATSYPTEHSKQDKLKWLSIYLPNFPIEKVFFIPFGKSKAEYVQPKPGDVLIDDYTDNLHDWEQKAHGKGIKMYNGINGTKGRWNGYSIQANMDPFIMMMQLSGIINA